MGSPPQDRRPSHETLARPSVHSTSYNNTPPTLQNHQDIKARDNLERLHGCRSTFLAPSKDIVPRRLPDTPCCHPTNNPKPTPEEINGVELEILASNLLTLTLDSKNSPSSDPISDDSSTYSLLNVDSTTPCVGHSTSPFKPYQLSDSNLSADIPTVEHHSQPSNSIEVALGARSTKRTGRKRNTSGDDQEDEDDGSGDDGNHVSHDSAKKKQHALACPYRKRDPERFNFHTHPKCTEPLRGLTGVKQHLKMKHMLPESELQRHGCHTFEDGITQDIERRLAARKLKIDTWEKLWELLFGEDTNIPSSDHEPCHIFERTEVVDLMKEVVNQTSQQQVSELENHRLGISVQDANGEMIDHIISTSLASRDQEDRTMSSAKRKSRAKQRPGAANTIGKTKTSQKSMVHRNHAHRKLAPKATTSNISGPLLPRSSAQESGPSSRCTARDTAPFDLTTHGGPSNAITSPAGSLRRSVRLTPRFAQTPLSAYPPIPSPGPWYAGGHHDQQQFEGYTFGWTPTADDIAEELNEDDGGA